MTLLHDVLKAIDNDEKILIWGDYDVDGTTGTVVLRKCFEILGAQTGFSCSASVYGRLRSKYSRA